MRCAGINYKRTSLACYSAYFTMSSVFVLPPLLFVTLRETYGISYPLLGTLVLTNFCTQLTVDLIFSFFSKHFNVKKVVVIMPMLTALGLGLYALIPTVLPQFAYGGLLLGTVLFSISVGLSEVLLSPIIAALPSDNPQRDMSLLHSLYAFGTLMTISVSTLFFAIFGTENWKYLVWFFAALPLFAAFLFLRSPMPNMDPQSERASKDRTRRRMIGMALCVACIFFGSCAENVMSNWVSGYIEKALGLGKTLGDILGMALFAILLALTRIFYAKYGKNIGRMLLVGMIGASICYLAVAFSDGLVIPVIACALTGLFTSMLWPGALILMEENIPRAGVAAYALMAAGGDLGAAVSPQLLGIVTDQVAASTWAQQLSASLCISPEQLGLKAGMLVSALFPIVGTVLMIVILRFFRRNKV